MFDTVKLHINIQLSEDELQAIDWNKTNSTEDHSNTRSKTLFKHYHKHDDEPRLIYRLKEDGSSTSSLKVEVSIPKFLYGNNVEQFREEDIPLFLTRLRQFLATALRLPVSRIPDLRFVETEKLHVCYNFDVGERKKDYLKAFSHLERAGYQLNVLGNSSSVYWEAKTRREKIYDKKQEIVNEAKRKKKTLNQHLVDRAKGLLRYEIELSDSELRKKSSKRLLGELLDFEWATHILQKGLSNIGASNLNGNTSFSDLIRRIDKHTLLSSELKNTLTAFVVRYHQFGEEYCRNFYPRATYYRLMNYLKDEFGISRLSFGSSALPPLFVERKRQSPSVITKYLDSDFLNNSLIMLENVAFSERLTRIVMKIRRTLSAWDIMDEQSVTIKRITVNKVLVDDYPKILQLVREQLVAPAV